MISLFSDSILLSEMPNPCEEWWKGFVQGLMEISIFGPGDKLLAPSLVSAASLEFCYNMIQVQISLAQKRINPRSVEDESQLSA
ncbi:3beta-hydroxysteroid-dehydrogenase/decarboxylase isoform 1 [Perilla frutescens var. hirtella]|nr:3beta-hydroxysteroid-dehydrogenase/decarboxylase isoform 1 [Perilla frutescens var. hirtella]